MHPAVYEPIDSVIADSAASEPLMDEAGIIEIKIISRLIIQ